VSTHQQNLTHLGEEIPRVFYYHRPMDDEQKYRELEYSRLQLEFLDYQNRVCYTRLMQEEQQKQLREAARPFYVRLFRRLLDHRSDVV